MEHSSPSSGGLGIDPAQDGDARLAEDVSDFGLFEAGSVVFKSKTIVGLIDMETAQAVGVGEEAELTELLRLERSLEIVCDFDQGHDAGIIAGRGS